MSLSPREQEIGGYLVRGYTDKEIASKIGLTHRGVRFHVNNMLSKLKAHSRVQVAVQIQPLLVHN